MSVQKKQLYELIDNFSENDTNKVLKFAKSIKKQKKQMTKPSDYFGVWKDEKLDVKKICRELRSEWDRDIL